MNKVLMCSPDHYEVRYTINPWMDRKIAVNKNLAYKQWSTLKKLIHNFLHTEIEVIKQKPSLPDMVFSADNGITFNKIFIRANFKYRQRQKETDFYSYWFKQQGFRVIKLPPQYKFEGGDFLFWGDKILAGFGFRTNRESIERIAKIIDKKTIVLKLIDPYLYHLDLAICPIDKDTLLYYPLAFDQKSQALLKREVKNLVPVSPQDAFNFVLNAIVHKKKIISKIGINGTLSYLQKQGFQIVQTDVSEFEKAGGGIHCLFCYVN